MSTKTVDAGTAHYVLMEGKERIGPKLLPLDHDVECLVIYGFSDKKPYEIFCKNSERALTPYPLVRFYLQSQVDEKDARLKLVVLDAVEPRAPILNAATMQELLTAHISGSKTLVASHQLVFDDNSSAYKASELRVET